MPDKKLTAGEIMQVLGKALTEAGVEYDDDNKITGDEWVEIIKNLILNAIAELND